MIELIEAIELVENELLSYPYPDGDRLIVLPDQAVSYEWGWLIFYTSEMWHQTGNISFAIAGNAPFIVERETGRLIETGTAEPIENYVKRYGSSGSIDA